MNIQDYKGVCVFAEQVDGKLSGIAFELLGKANVLAKDLGTDVTAVVIGYEIKGSNGFGYDPILYLPECGCSSAELTLEQKNELSHRGKALRLMKEKLAEVL